MAQQEFDDWDDDFEIEPVTSGVEAGSELDAAIRRTALEKTESGVVPPHGPRAYKRAAQGSSVPPVRDVSADEVLFDDAAEWRGQPTVRIDLDQALEQLAEENAGSEKGSPLAGAPPRRLLLGLLALTLAACAVGAGLAYKAKLESAEREEQIRSYLEAAP